MARTLIPTWTRPLAWLALPLVVAALLVATRTAEDDRPGRAAEAGREWVFIDPPDPAVVEMGRRLRLRQAVADEVRAGRLSLFEAAAVYRVFSRAMTEQSWEYFLRRYPGVSDEERHCRQVIDWVGATVLDERSEDDGSVARLRAELEGALRQGPLVLPGAIQALSIRGPVDGAAARLRSELRGELEGIQRRSAPSPEDE